MRLEESQRTWIFEGLSMVQEKREHFRPGTNEVGVPYSWGHRGCSRSTRGVCGGGMESG